MDYEQRLEAAVWLLSFVCVFLFAFYMIPSFDNVDEDVLGELMCEAYDKEYDRVESNNIGIVKLNTQLEGERSFKVYCKDKKPQPKEIEDGYLLVINN